MGTYIRLIDFKDADNKRIQFANKDNYYVRSNSEYNSIPGGLYAYWITQKSIEQFEKGMLGDSVVASVGIQTGDNDLFLRFWWEVDKSEIKFDARDVNDSFQEKKWFPYNKGGEYRRWYGNDYMVINWKNDGEAIKKNSELTGHHYQQYANSLKFKPFITWSRVTTGIPAFRYKDYGYLSDMAGFSLYGEEDELYNVLGFCNSIVARYYLDFLAPTLNIMTGPVLSMPYNKEGVNVKDVVSEMVEDAKAEWDDYEYSFGFTRHPLMKESLDGKSVYIKDLFTEWEEKCKTRFEKVKNNEKKNNEIFINTFGLNSELSAEIDDSDVSVRLADLERDIKSLISYAVGCVMGRYSINNQGIAFAGGKWDASKYPEEFQPCEYGVMPITEEQYFEEDLCTKVIDFLRISYGEETLADNLKYISSALKPNSYDSPKKIIREYLFGEFFDDHYQIYQHRPIYWQMDSGKVGGFRAILYMHRYNENTLPFVRTEFIQDLRYKYEEDMLRKKERIESASSTAEKNSIKKEITVLDKKVMECAAYDELLNHITSSMDKYSIELDEGVKCNYSKFIAVDGDKNKNILTAVKL